MQDAYKAGFDESEIRAAGLYNKLEKAGTTAKAADDILQNSTGQAASQGWGATNGKSSKSFLKNLKESRVNAAITKRAKNLASNAIDLASMTPIEMKDTIVGKAGATKQEFVSAYKLLQDTEEYKTNLMYRSALDSAYKTINS